MTTTPRVSVIIPSRDCRALLPKALESVRCQEIEALEVLVVDDGSSDGTWDWLCTEAASWPALRPLRAEGGGPNRARNLALGEVRAPLVAFLDADDWWRPNKLAGQLAWHEFNPSVVLSFHDYLHVDTDGRSHGTCFDFWRHRGDGPVAAGYRRLEDATATLLAQNVVGTSTVMARRDALLRLGGFDAGLPSAADWDLWLRLSGEGEVAACADVGADWLMRPGSFSADSPRRIDGMRRIVERHAGRVPSGRAVAIARARIAIAEAEASRAAGQRGTALLAHGRALALAPSKRTARAFAVDLWRLGRGA